MSNIGEPVREIEVVPLKSVPPPERRGLPSLPTEEPVPEPIREPEKVPA